MFDDVLKGAKASKKNKTKEVKSATSKTKDIDEATTSTPPVDQSSEAPKKRKSSGKRTDPSYKQVGAYVKKDTYLQIQKLLLDKPDKDFSDLVQELLSTYLDNQLTD